MAGLGRSRFWLRRLGWLLGLWLAGVAALGLVALAIKALMRVAGLTV
ncbi:MAG: hypothetical protein JWR60_4275 [Polaromonas sp.]|nr:hypothetical protein [Polaromonas sp.]